MSKNNSKKISPQSKNTLHISVPPIPDYDSLKPDFSFHDIRYRKKGCLSNCEMKAKASVVDLLFNISQFTWKEIHSKPKEHYGYEKISAKDFKFPLAPTVTKETKLLVFRFSEPGRIAGYRMKNILHIVAVGPKHDMY